MYFFFFSSRRRHTRYIGDWSSDVCSSDLDVNLDDAALKHVVAELVEHLGLGGVDDVAEVHVGDRKSVV